MSDAAHATYDWLLDDLIGRVPGIESAVLLSADGLLLGASRDLDTAGAEHAAAMAAGFQSLARSASRHFRAGGVRQTVIEMDHAFFLVTAAGDGAHLAVVTGPDADIGAVAYEMAMLVTSLTPPAAPAALAP